MNPLIEFTKWLLKWMIIVTGGILALALLVGSGIWTWNWLNHERHIPALRVVVINGEAPIVPSNVVAGEKSAESLCRGEFPIFVGYTNESSRTVERISISVVAHLPEHSTNILGWEAEVTMDRIVAPKAGFGGCWKFPLKTDYQKNPKSFQANYEGKVRSVTFKD